MWIAMLAAGVLAHAAKAEYRPVNGNVLFCQQASMLPLARLAWVRMPNTAMTEKLTDNGHCLPSFDSKPVIIDFFEDVPWWGSLTDEQHMLRGTERIGRGRIPDGRGGDFYFYVDAKDLVPIK